LATSAQHHSVLDVNAATHRNTLQHHPTNCNRACAWVTSAHHKAPCRSLLGSLRCNTLQHTATHCNTLQHAATHRNTLQQGRRTGTSAPLNAPCRSPRGSLCCNTLQHTVTHFNTLQHTATHCNTPQQITTGPAYGRLPPITTRRVTHLRVPYFKSVRVYQGPKHAAEFRALLHRHCGHRYIHTLSLTHTHTHTHTHSLMYRH